MRLNLFTLLAGLIILAGCTKEGCTDPNSVNFDPDATKSNNSCKYETKLTFWHNMQTADSLTTLGSHALKYYVDSVLIGSSASSVYFNAAPACEQLGSTTFITQIEGVEKNVKYYVKDQNHVTLWSGNVTIQDNSCKTVQLTF